MRKKAHKSFARTERVAELILRELAYILQRGKLSDPKAAQLNLTAVQVTRDFSLAKVYYTLLDDTARELTAQLLEQEAGALRTQLSRRLSLFVTPRLRFLYDDSVERGLYMSHLIDTVLQENPIPHSAIIDEGNSKNLKPIATSSMAKD